MTRSPEPPQPVRSTETTPAAETERPSGSDGASAFERAGALKRPPNERSALARDTLLAFNNAVQEKSFAGFYREQTSATFRKQFTLQKFSDAFQVFIEKNYDISNVAKAEPVFDPAPAIDKEGVLVLKGYYATRPNKVTFLLRYVREGSDWKVLGINVQAVPFVENTGKVPSEQRGERARAGFSAGIQQSHSGGKLREFLWPDLGALAAGDNAGKTDGDLSNLCRQEHKHYPDRQAGPSFDEPPAINADGFLVAKGSYATAPSKVFFELKYVDEDGAWKLIGINVNVKPVADKLGKKAADDE